MRLHRQCLGILFSPLLLTVLLSAATSNAQQPNATESPLQVESQLRAASTPTLSSPLKIGAQVQSPLWNEQGLWRSVPRLLPGLEKVQRPGIPVFDPSSHSWFATAQGSLVQIPGDGRLVVVTDNVQGIDVDVRAAVSRAVSREPNDTIVLHSWTGASPVKKVLKTGAAFFGPRFSPEASRILVRESRAGGGHFWVLGLDGTAVDLGQGYDPVWHPDGKHIVFARITHNGLTIASADLWLLNVETRAERVLQATSGVAEVQPTISPDGRWVAFADARTGEGYVAELNLAAGRR